MDSPLFTIANTTFTLGEALIGAGALIALLVVVLVIALFRLAGARKASEKQAIVRSEALETALSDVMRAQAEMGGRMQTMAEIFGDRQSDMGRALGERLDGLGHRLGRSMADTTKTTSDTLRQLHERMALIDRAQKTISELTGQVHDLRQILSDKQTRGVFGQGRMEAIIRDGLPAGTYEFQATLSNNTRPDCVVQMPNAAPGLIIDAKFPLEAYKKVKEAAGEQEAHQASQQFKRDIAKHVLDIRDRYLLPGETQDTAFMFVPSESIFAELHEFHEDVVQKAHRARVVIVSPALLMLSIQVVQALLKDARMREEAHVIQAEVGKLMADVNRLGERVINLQKHFAQANRDVEQILVSTDKISKRGSRIENLEFDDRPVEPAGTEPAAAPQTPPANPQGARPLDRAGGIVSLHAVASESDTETGESA
ncbi:MAG: DNA recombination protein RmuC [Pseudomonadota bacterium]